MDIKAIVEEAESIDYISCYPIEDFTLEELNQLARLSKDRVKINIRYETSNFHCGVLVEVKNKSCMIE